MSRFSKLIVLSLIPLVTSGCIWERVYKKWGIIIWKVCVWEKVEAPDVPPDDWCGGVVVDNGIDLSDIELLIDTGTGLTPVPLVEPDPEGQSLIAARMQADGDYNPATQTIQYFQTAAGPIDAQQVLQVQTSFSATALMDGSPTVPGPGIAPGDSWVVKGTTMTDLHGPQEFWGGVDDPLLPLCGIVPTVSEWGLIVMTLLLLTAGTIVFGRRRRPAVA